MADAAIPVAPRIWRIPTTEFDFINSYLLMGDDGQVTLVDTGLKGGPKRILAALEQLGSAPSQVTTILLTHSHADHAGGAAGMAAATGRGMTVHEDDAEFVRTGTGAPLDPSTRLGRLVKRAQRADPAPVDRTLQDGEVLDVVPGGLRVHHTPGHSPGHVSFLLPGTGVLITGDAIWNVRSRRTWPVLAFCTNVAMLETTAELLGELEYTTAAFTHGPHIEGQGRTAVREFLAQPRRFRTALF
jgi:glyoxylase-like metal-dependent hydrolase (beta-lactamase superfamily II)